jgi:hypothetical protein
VEIERGDVHESVERLEALAARKRAQVEAAEMFSATEAIHTLEASCPVESAPHSKFMVWDLNERHCYHVARPHPKFGTLTIVMKRAGTYVLKWYVHRQEMDRAELTTASTHLSRPTD